MLKIQLKGKQNEAIWIVEKLYAIGRAPTNNLVIDDDSISPVHAKLITQKNKLILKDNHSEHGCFVNERRVTQKELVPGDVVRLGTVEIDVLAPQEPGTQSAATGAKPQPQWALVADSSWLAGREFKIAAERVTIGRGSICDITIPGTHLSRQHVEVKVEGNHLQVRDLASANGTYINEKRITEGVVRPGDRLRLDVYSFRVIGPGDDQHRTQVRRAPSAVHTKPVPKTPPPPKQWKTRPTSPGNRIEPEPPKRSGFVIWLSVGLCAIMLVALAYLLSLK